MSGPEIKIDNLSCGYSGVTILNNISISVEKEEIVGIIGPNGTGKTTLLRAITKIIPIKNGYILIDNNDNKKIKSGEMSKIIAVVKQYCFLSNITVYDFLAMGRIPYKNKLDFFENRYDREIIDKYLKLTDIYHLKDKYVDRISGGEIQLASIARALVQEPSILLLDEPTTFLDIGHKKKILDLIKKLNREFRITIIMVLHDLNLASEYCDKLLVINKGEFYQYGSPSSIINKEMIKEVYGINVETEINPVSSKPYIILSSEN